MRERGKYTKKKRDYGKQSKRIKKEIMSIL